MFGSGLAGNDSALAKQIESLRENFHFFKSDCGFIGYYSDFGLFGIGNPATGVGITMLIISMIVYGVAFDFFNVSGSLFVDKETDPSIRSSAQGVFMLMTNGFGAMIGTLGAQWVINKLVNVHINAYTAVHGMLPGARPESTRE